MLVFPLWIIHQFWYKIIRVEIFFMFTEIPSYNIQYDGFMGVTLIDINETLLVFQVKQTS